MAFDYKKEYKEFYLPPKKPGIVDVPEMNYVAVRGKGNPNEPDGEYKTAMGLLYGIAFTIKMSYKGNQKIEGYFPYVVPPLEGLWYQDGAGTDIDYSRKDDFRWVSMIRVSRNLSPEKCLTGQSGKRPRKRKPISPKQNSSHIMKAHVHNVCI